MSRSRSGVRELPDNADDVFMTLPSLSRGAAATLHHADALTFLSDLPDASFDAVVTDPPYAIRRLSQKVLSSPPARRDACEMLGCVEGEVCPACTRADLVAKYSDAPMLGQQSQNWHESATHSRGYADNDPGQFGVWCALWLNECLRVLKPGAHLIAFGGTRTWHRLVCAAEDAGFEIRDSLAWLYSSGMPKSQDVRRALAQSASSPEEGHAADEWAGWGTTLKPAFEPIVLARRPLNGTMADNVRAHGVGPLNLTPSRHLGSDSARRASKCPSNVHMDAEVALVVRGPAGERPDDFFWVSKPQKRERPNVDGVAHPTVKPLDLVRLLVQRVTPPGGLVLDPFVGSGTTIEACMLEGRGVVGIERDAAYIPLIHARMERTARDSGATSAASATTEMALF